MAQSANRSLVGPVPRHAWGTRLGSRGWETAGAVGARAEGERVSMGGEHDLGWERGEWVSGSEEIYVRGSG